MTFVLVKNYDQYAIVNDADFIAGRVYPLNGREGPYLVTADVAPMGPLGSFDAGVVNSLSDAIPAFLAYHEKYLLRWDRLHDEWWKTTLYAILRIVQDRRGYWSAYRNGYPLLRDGTPACFATDTEAQRAADTHELDGYPNAKEVGDGLSWQPDPEFDWRSIPHRVANWQRSASSLLP